MSSLLFSPLLCSAGFGYSIIQLSLALCSLALSRSRYKMNASQLLLSGLKVGQRVFLTYRRSEEDHPLYRLAASAGIHSDMDAELVLDDIFEAHGMILLAFRNPWIPMEQHQCEKFVSLTGDVYYRLDLKHDGIVVDTVTLL